MKAKYRKDYKSPDFTVTEISLDFTLSFEKTYVTSVLQLKRLNAESKVLTLDGHSFVFDGVKLNGEEFNDFTQTKETLELNVDLDEFELEIKTILNPENNTSLQGLYKSGEGLCTQCEAEGFRQITYMLDRPDVLAKYTTKITALKADFPILLSNGNRIEEGDLENGYHFVKWQDPFAKPCYLFALVAGDFDILKDTFTTKSGRDVALEVYVDKGNLYKSSWAMESLKRSMKWDEERFNLEYDLDIFMIVAVDFFNMGAMENKGLNIFNSSAALADPKSATDTDYIRIEGIIGHEYFHNWTGNRVTCRDWFQLSLKEGLTVFRDQEFTCDHHNRPVHRISDVCALRTMQFAEDASVMSHPIRPEKVIEMNNFYTMTVYEKGAEVIRMIHTLLGEERFQKGIALYIKENDGKAATCEDFVSAMERGGEIDLTQFRRWYSQSGTPKLSASGEFDGKTYRLTLAQKTDPTFDQAEKLPLHIPVKIALLNEQGEEIELVSKGEKVSNLLELKEESQVFEFDTKEKVIPALLLDFSAPVKFSFPYADSDLHLLVSKATNDFVRFDSLQTLYVREIAKHYQEKQDEIVVSPALFETLNAVLDDTTQGNSMKALMLKVPSMNELYEILPAPIDPIYLSKVRREIIKQIAKSLVNLTATYESLEQSEFSLDADAMEKRALRNCLLDYRAAKGDEQIEEVVKVQFEKATNMTDQICALNVANSHDLTVKDVLNKAFEAEFENDPLVMDKYFASRVSNSSANIFDELHSLLEHPKFNIKNPNRARALIGSFAMNNKQFHNETGVGYRFLGKMLAKLNGINPQVASRLIEPLIKFKHLDVNRQSMMKEELEKLKNLENLSKDMFEKIEKALA